MVHWHGAVCVVARFVLTFSVMLTHLGQHSGLAQSEAVAAVCAHSFFNCKERLCRDVFRSRPQILLAKQPGFKIDCSGLTGAEGADRRRCS